MASDFYLIRLSF